MPHVRSVAVGVWLKRGSRHERREQSGISHFIEHMVFKGTRHRSAEQIAAEMDSIGGHMDAFTAKEYAAFHLKVLDEHLPQAVELLADIVLNPLFDSVEMKREKSVIFEEMGMVEDAPDDLVGELFTGAFWPEHPLGRPILGTRRSVARLRREDLARFFRRVYHAGNVVIAAAGNLSHGRLARTVSRHFAGLRPGPRSRPGPAPRPAGRVIIRHKEELEQVHVCLGTAAFSQVHPQRFASYVLNTVLGGSMSSRLFQNVREKRGLAYAISSGIASYSDAGSLAVYAGTNLDAVDQVLSLTLEEMRRLRDVPLPEDELRRAKDNLKGSLVLGLEGTGSRMSHLARQEIYFGRVRGLEEALVGIEVVTAGDVQRVAREFFQGRPALSVVGSLNGYRPRRAELRF